MDPVTGTTFDEAIHLIEDFVGQTEGTTDPLGVQELFKRTVYQDVDIRTGSGGLKKRFVVHTDGGLQPPGITASVREAMRKALQAVEGRQLSSEESLAVKQVRTQLSILNEIVY